VEGRYGIGELTLGGGGGMGEGVFLLLMGGVCIRVVGEGVHLLLDPALVEDDLLTEVVDGGTEGNSLEGFLPRQLLLLLDLPVVVVEALEDVSALDGGRPFAFWQG
jgi:hypothetical protein